MPITINGSGSIAGISVGGLENGCVNEADLATAAVTNSKLAAGAVSPDKMSQSLTLGTAVASTSGTSIDFTGIPSWTKKITVMFNGVSTNGTSLLLIQIGSGSFTTSGYASGAAMIDNTTASSTLVTTGFAVEPAQNATITRHGAISLFNRGSDVWVASGILHYVWVAGRICYSAGNSGALSGALDRVRITTVNGTDTFDAGSINIMWEG